MGNYIDNKNLIQNHKINDLLSRNSADKLKNLSPNQEKELNKIKNTAEEFEAFVVSNFYKIYAEKIPVNKFSGGGKGEEIFRSILIDEQVKKALKGGNSIGINKTIIESILRKHGISEQKIKEILNKNGAIKNVK